MSWNRLALDRELESAQSVTDVKKALDLRAKLALVAMSCLVMGN